MKQKSLSNWLKAILIGIGVCGLVFYLYILPDWGKSLAERYPEFAGAYWPWLILLWITAVPCYVALVLGWKIAVNIGRDRSFSQENARLLKWISWLAAGDTAFYFAGTTVRLFLNMNHPGIVLLAMVVAFAGVAVAVAAAALSHLVQKAADLQEQSDLTI
ncbi:MAG: DUF2975 domain-containing protein [Lachnospiraceae bacterium]|nr:DUF2975 domain-containing protein [Lachnospiraceae bacterium]